MSNQLPTLKLSDLTLAQNEDSKLALTATGEPVLIDPANGQETPLPLLPALTLGIGQAVTVPQRIQDGFSTDGLTFDAADFGLWLTTATVTDDEPAWFGSFTTAGIDLYGVHDLADDVLQLDGMSFSQMALRVALQIRGTAVTRALFVIAGQVHITQSVANVELNGLTLSFSLGLDVADVADLGALLAEPASILDAPFSGRLHFTADARRLAIGDYFSIQAADCVFDMAVHSPAGDRHLHPGDINFTLQAGALNLVGTQIQQLDLACGYESDSQRLFMRGSADINLPTALNSVLTTDTSDVSGSFDFEHKPVNNDRLTTLEIGIDTLALAPSINFLELGARDIGLAFTYRDRDTANDIWTLSLNGVGCQSWSRMAARLVAAGIVQLPGAANLPDVQGTLAIDLQDNAGSGHLAYRIDFLRPDTGCRTDLAPVPFDNTFGPLPVRLADAHLALSLDYDQHGHGDWQVQGAGLFSTAAWLYDYLPLNGLAFSAAAQGSGENLPTVALTVTGGMPMLRLPPLIPGSAAMEIFQPQRLAVRLGETLSIDGQALIPNPADLLSDLNLPPQWNGIITPISDTLTGLEATLAIRVPLADGDEAARLALTIEPINPPEFRLMEAIAEVVRAAGGSAIAEPDPDNPLDSSARDFFTARPHKIELDMAAGGDQEFTLTLSFSFSCSVFGETFDTTAAFRFVDGQPELLLMAGLTDPIRLVIPGIDPVQVLGNADLSRIVSDYDLDRHLSQIDPALFSGAEPADALATLQGLEDRLRSLFGSPGMDNSLVFEIRDFGLRVRLDRAPSVSGTVRLVQLPGILDAVMPENGFDFGLGCSLNRIFISVKGPATRSDSGLFEPHETDPLFSLPLGRADGQDQFLHLFFGRFELEYSWTTNAFGFVFDAAVVPAPDSLQGLNLLGNGVYFPGQSTFVKISKSISTGHLPIIIPEWAFSFAREASVSVDVDSATDEMGLQLYIGVPDTRLFTAFFKEFTFSPTYYLMQPGVAVDGGFVIGPHQPLNYPSRDAFIGSLVAGEAGDQLLIHVEIDKGVALLMPSSLGAMLNPLTLIPPFITPIPPFWIYPPYYMGDIYFDSVSMSVNLPHLLFFGIRFSRPLPSLSIQGMMELAALAMSGFEETIPDHSELRQVMYATLEVNAKLPLIETLGGGPLPELHLFFEVNVVDIVNGLIQMKKAVQTAIEGGADVVETLLDDPAALVRMIPVEVRRFEFPPPDHPSATYRLMGLAFSGSLYVLTPDEFAAELKLFHEGQRVQPKGLAASQPRQRIVTDHTSGPAPLTVQFNLTAGGGEPPVDSVHWDFGDGASSEQKTPTHQFAQPGKYAVTATATDIQGQSRTARLTIVVEGAALLQTLQHQAIISHPLRYVGNPLTYFTDSDPLFEKYARQKGEVLFAKVRDARLAPQKFENERRKRVQEWIEQMWKPIASTPVGAADQRKKLWEKAGIAEITEDFEKQIKKAAGQRVGNRPVRTPIIRSTDRPVRGRPVRRPPTVRDTGRPDPDKPIHTLTTTLQDTLRQGLIKLVQNALAHYTVVEGPSKTDLAGQLVKRIVQIKKRVSRGRSSSYTINLLATGKRSEVVKEILPPDRFEQGVKKIEACFEPVNKIAAAGKTLTAAEVKALQQKLLACIGDQIIIPGKTIDSLQALPIFQLDADALSTRLAKKTATRAKMVSEKVTVTAFDGGLTRQWLKNNLTSPPFPGDENTVQEMTGYVIRSRPHPSGQTFTVPVAHATPLYRVQRHAGRYQLLLFEDRDIVETHPLPAWLSEDFPEAPNKPEKLRAQLFVTEDILTRPRTPAEATWADRVNLVDGSYQKSIFSRTEYEIKEDGGIHGAMSIGDLLCKKNGDYILPAGPVLLTGCYLQVWDAAELKLAGLLAAPDNVFLNGYYSLPLKLGRYTLELEGDFRLIAGQMWSAALAGNGAFTANALNFNGSAEFKDDSVTKLRGAASGTIATDSTDLEITIDVEYHDSWTLEIGDAKLFKVTLDTGFDVQVKVTHDSGSSEFQLAAGAGLEVQAWTVEPDDMDMIPVEIVPAITACASVPILPPPLPDGPFFTTECITTPAVVVDVPDFSNPDWQPFTGEISADLQINASGSSLAFELHVVAGNHDVTFYDLTDLIND